MLCFLFVIIHYPPLKKRSAPHNDLLQASSYQSASNMKNFFLIQEGFQKYQTIRQTLEIDSNFALPGTSTRPLVMFHSQKFMMNSDSLFPYLIHYLPFWPLRNLQKFNFTRAHSACLAAIFFLIQGEINFTNENKNK